MIVVYVLTTPLFEDGENATVDQIRRRAKWVMRSLGWHLKEIHMTGSHFGKKRMRLQLYTKVNEENLKGRGDGITNSSDSVRILVTASERYRLKKSPRKFGRAMASQL
ncbi:hypothetical protein Tco_1107846 [Tanacetum coccineum]